MKKSDLYRKAAEILSNLPLEASRGCCFAIGVADGTGDYSNANQKAFHQVFEPDGFLAGYYFERAGDTYEDIRECRLLALCFMAAMVDGDVRLKRT